MPQTISHRPEMDAILCLSGGGFRATLFHLGALRRLNELGVLAQLKVITSVSGGSILNGLLASRWHRLLHLPDGTLGGFRQEIELPIRSFCGKDLRTRLLLGTRLNPINWPVILPDFLAVRANFLAAEYEKFYEEAWLSGVPQPQAGQMPRFIFCATNVLTGACWHFHTGPNGKMGDFYTGYMKTGRTSIAQAVAASSAFPPGFGALRLNVEFPDAFDRVDPWGKTRPLSKKRADLPQSAKQHILLTDGGVYDNLGVEPVWQCSQAILVSDAGLPFSSKAKCRQAAVPRLARAAAISMEQVGAVRKRWLIERIDRNEAKGALWAIDTPIEDYPIPNPQGYGREARRMLASVRTDLNSFTEGEMNCLENHGYSLADAAIRSRAPDFCVNLTAPFCFPHPDFARDVICQQFIEASAHRKILLGVCKYVLQRAKEDWICPLAKFFGGRC